MSTFLPGIAVVFRVPNTTSGVGVCVCLRCLRFARTALCAGVYWDSKQSCLEAKRASTHEAEW